MVKQYMDSIGLDLALYPPNMTGMLQVLDLVVNGPIKQHTRRMRVKRLVAAFRAFKTVYDIEFTKSSALRVKLSFQPPKPTLQEGMQDLFDLFEGDFNNPDFKESIAKSFVSTGTVPIDVVSKVFVEYFAEQQAGSISIEPKGSKSKEDVGSVLSSYSDSQIQNLVEVAAAEGDVLIGDYSGALDFEDDNDLDVIDDSLEDNENIYL